ncbi:hypothetical protein AN640_00865 [Candidatus Epulonipiscium fishelsonii]|uniref:Uncharacterized protein n=1 Tax=Candidatus Epulonipiscium fishelsonii TaxID=77094 RepID=A0ACC8XJD1_9FIRM|nr:hypothetical protein AN640_00865 [Epulopiscium sp. SCG-D08WGA-EpuloA1]OON91664.1 MAG: hypothetical protein ATN32_02230 [Epulopiscium sp. AS2M-Bin002]
MHSIYSGIAGLRTHQIKMDVISNNVANVNTLGYEGKSTTFADTVSQLFNETQNFGDATETLKMSNVNLAIEFAEMINVKNGFKVNSKIITTSDENLQELINLKNK